jgi:hypothetical protein
VSENPWQELPDMPPFVLPVDKEIVESFNRKQQRKEGRSHALNLDLVPEAFLGRPGAPLVLLGNIAGVSETGDPPPAYKLKTQFAARLRKNLLHQHDPADFPFVYLDPSIISLGGNWWLRRLTHILDEFYNSDAAHAVLAQYLLSVEFFPYICWSNRYAHDSLRLESQEYSRFLVREAVKQKAVIVLRRGERRWLEAVPELGRYPHLVRLKSYQRGTISPNNCRDNGWSHIRDVVRKMKAILT